MQGIIFYLAFSFLRSYAGGFHASTEGRCIAFSSALIFICVYSFFLGERFDLQIPFAVLTAVASVIIILLSPIDCKEKPLSQKEKSKYRKKSIVLLLAYLIVVAVSTVLFYYKIAYALSAAIILSGLLVILGYIKNKHIKNK